MNEQTDPDVIPTSDFNGHRPQADIPFTFRRRLNWGDSDTAEIGYVSKLIDFGQEAVEMWWEAVLGTNWYLMKQDNMANPAVSIQIDFLAPVVVGDRVDVSVLIEKLGNASIAYRIEGHKVGGGHVFTGLYTHALVTDVHSDKIKAKPFPDGWRRQIEGYRRECALRADGVRTRREVLDFWFAPPGSPERGRKREQWFAKQSEATNGFDSEITERFLATYEAAARGDLDHWADSLDGMVALCILLDQFPRNMFRGTARAFATDARILAMVKDSIDRGLDADLHDIPGHFLYLPFEHSENLADQRRYLELVARWADRPRGPDIAKYGRLHMELIERFGRFPHRNAALGRESTPEELAYLEHPDAGF
jgi:uncharacterized protein (DUF924 family)/acyl-CoA thioesterase FadM